jgi:hypothetical protein
MFLGHAPNHASDVFHFLNLETRHVIISRNVIWLDKMYGDWKRLEPKDIEYVADDDDDEENHEIEHTDASNPGRDEELESGDDGEIELEINNGNENEDLEEDNVET